MTKHINLIRKMAWLWHQTTGVNWDDLFSEALLAYALAAQGHDPYKEASVSTFAYKRIEYRLINFCKVELRNKSIEFIDDWAGAVEHSPDYEYFQEALQDYSKDVLSIIKMVQRKPQRYSRKGITDRQGIGNIRKDLRRKLNWTFPRINQAMQDLRLELLD